MTILGSTNPGYVGIGIATPQNKIHLDAGSLQITNATTGNSTSGKGLLIGQSSSGSANVEINQQENAPMNFLTNGAARLKIQSDGKVALGNYTTFTANSLLHQYVNSATETYHQFTNSTTGAGSGTTGLQVGIDANGNAIFKNNYSSGSNGAMNFYTNAAERMRISNSGLVGIGVASPVAQLDIATSALVTSGAQILNDQTGNTIPSSGSIYGLNVSTTSGNNTNTSYGALIASTGPGQTYGVYTSASSTSTATTNHVTAGSFNINNASTYNIGVQTYVYNGSTNLGYSGVISSSANATNWGVYSDITSTGTSSDNKGMYGTVNGTGTSTTNYGGAFSASNGLNSYGVYGSAAGGSNLNYGVYGVAATSCTGSTYGSGGTGSCASAAGYFSGAVQTTNDYYKSSDQILKTNVNPLVNATSLLSQVEPKTYYYDTVQFNHFNLNGNLQYGLIAQQIENTFPQFVKRFSHPAVVDNSGNTLYPAVDYKGIAYENFIPILIAAVKEQQLQIDALNSQLKSGNSTGELQQDKNKTTVELTNAQTVYLSNAIPNPFVDNATIKFSIPENVKTAQIIFTENNGIVLKSVTIEQRGESSLTVFGENLSKGIYSYSLIIDGKVFETKKMVKQ